MATKTGNSGKYNVSTGNQYISGYVEWVETYDDQTYESTNKTTVTQKVYLHRTNTYSSNYNVNSSGTRTAYFGSETVKNTDKQNLTIGPNPPGNYTCIFTASKEITHDSDGSKTITLGVETDNNANIGGFEISKTTKSVTLMTIPRYASITQHYVSKASTNSLTVYWDANTNCNGLQCSLNGGGWFDVSGYPEYTLTGLTPNTTYSIKTRVRKTASGYWTESGVIYGTTVQKTPVISSFYVSGRTSTSITCAFAVDSCQTWYYKLSTQSGWTQTGNASGRSFTISGLSPNTTYTINLICRNWINQSNDTYKDATSNVSGTTHQTTVASISVSSKTSTSVTVSSNCNVTVSSTRYRIMRSGGGYGSWQTSATFSGLAANTTYTVQVEKVGQASGEAGYATVSVTTHQTTVASITLSSKTSTSITVSSSCNVTASSTKYRIMKSGGSYGSWQTGATFSGLSANTTYTVQVEKIGQASGEAGYATVSATTYQTTIPTISLSSRTIKTITVTSGCNVTVSSTKYRIKKSSDSNYGAWQDSATFSNLVYNTAYDIQVQKTGKDSGESATATLSNVYTLDIARITNYNPNWNVEESIIFNMTNVGNCVMRLYLLYNGVEIIYRNNISLTNDQYIFTLTTEEKNSLYSLAAGETNPNFKFVLRSYYDSVLVGSDSEKAISIEFPTKAWTKIDNNWKRALVWGKLNGSWRQSLPWVKIDNIWRRI